MSKFTVAFKYISDGEIEVEAKNYDEAEIVAEELLNSIRETGNMTHDSRIVWSGDEVEL